MTGVLGRFMALLAEHYPSIDTPTRSPTHHGVWNVESSTDEQTSSLGLRGGGVRRPNCDMIKEYHNIPKAKMYATNCPKFRLTSAAGAPALDMDMAL